MQQDYYDVLGVPKQADSASIKKAYRKLAMEFHPDRNPGNKEAEEKFKKAAEAYDILGDPEKRSKYDQFGHAAFQSGQGGFHGGFSSTDDIFSAFGDIFEDFFGNGGGRARASRGGRGRSSARRGADLRYILDIELKDVIKGTEKEVSFDCEDDCDPCKGTGADPKHGVETCGTCGGSGQVVRAQGFFSMASSCPSCRGQGQIIKKPCSSCHGAGRNVSHRKIKVKIPAGVDTGVRLRVSGEGEGGYQGGPGGDLYVEVNVLPHKNFRRKGTNLYGAVELSYLKAILGAEVEVETFDGKKKLRVPQGTQPGQSLRISGYGLPSLKSKSRGDLFFEVDVDIPKKLKKEEEALLREIAKIRNEEVNEPVGLFGKKKK